jgi:energy-coupling factor transporter ATP-binding protein EcfA2
MSHRRRTLAAPPPDPFGEHRGATWRERLQLLGGQFDFETDSARLLRIVRTAYERLPQHRFSGKTPRFRVRLMLTAAAPARAGAGSRREPAPVKPLAADGILCGAMGPASFVTLTPRQRSALIVVARDMLRHAYHVRYELLEFAVYVLAARGQGLIPLHAACLGDGDGAVLLCGRSGSGKSTLVLHALLAGLDFMAEDSVLVKPSGLLATGLASYVHMRPDALRFLTQAQRSALLRSAVPIRRRSGIEKLEIDLRCRRYRLADRPLPIRAVVFLSARSDTHRLLRPLRTPVMLERLAAQQRYAARQPGWRTFRRQIAQLPAYELRRGRHPQAAVEELRGLLAHSGARREAPVN